MNQVSQLALKAQEDSACMLELWESVQRLISVWANRYYNHNTQGNRSFDIDDLMQAGYLATAAAVNKFKKGVDYEFTTSLYFHVQNYFARTAGTRGKKKRPETFAASLQEPIGEDNSINRGDFIPDPQSQYMYDDLVDSIALSEDFACVMQEVYSLSKPQQQAVIGNICQGKTIKQVAAALGCTDTQAYSHKENGLRKLRSRPSIRKLEGSYRHVTYSRWKITHTSTVEELILARERQGEYRHYFAMLAELRHEDECKIALK